MTLRTICEALQYEDEISMRLGKLYTYAHMRYDQDTTNSVYQALNDRANKFIFTRYLVAQHILCLKFYRFQEDISQMKFLKENRELSVYEHALEEITRQRPNVLSGSGRGFIS